MTEADWLTGADPAHLLGFIGSKLSPRAVQLFAAGCCARLTEWLSDPGSQAALDVLYRHADQRARPGELLAAYRNARRTAWSARRAVCVRIVGEQEYERMTRQLASGPDPFDLIAATSAEANATRALELALRCALVDKEDDGVWAAREAAVKAVAARCAQATVATDTACRERQAQCDLLREIAGNPFRPVDIESPGPAWQTRTVQQLAWVIERDCQWSLMPILGDALEDAGCTAWRILAHCREAGEHVRGCWVVAAICGKHPSRQSRQFSPGPLEGQERHHRHENTPPLP